MRTLLVVFALLFQVPTDRQPATAPLPGELSISVDVDLVDVLFTVSDRKGRRVSSLPWHAFQVFDNNKAQVITHFSSETDSPLTVALLMDTSGSVRDKVWFERDAAIGFLQSTLRPGKDRALLITFDTSLNLLQDYTDDIAALAQAAERIRVGGGTPLYDAVYWAASEKLARQPGRRIMVVLSDGNDTTSHKTFEDALQAAQRNDATIYCISTNSILKNSFIDAGGGNKILRRLAEDTGGRMFLPARTKDLSAVFKKINEDLRSQYVLAFGPSDARQDGSFHEIRIETTDRHLQVQARNGYFAARKE